MKERDREREIEWEQKKHKERKGRREVENNEMKILFWNICFQAIFYGYLDTKPFCIHGHFRQLFKQF